ncbi:hypothetical protein ACFYMX_24090 [Streptomyces griseofuscus]|uniref:hypothetical protein n=1 Tax=Streptomyces TaxID=1883 RepID=UPI0018F0B804|nr:hypothetical protein [Streptomyces sp. CRPSP2-6A1]MBJ7005511.1 hypothetical protein [Streptomyces sp. CRPSP2-6A1]
MIAGFEAPQGQPVLICPIPGDRRLLVDDQVSPPPALTNLLAGPGPPRSSAP